MKTVNIHEAKTHLSRLLEQVSQGGDPFIIAKAGRPIARVIAADAPEPKAVRRLGFLAGELQIPDDFDHLGAREISRLLGITDDPAA